MKLLHSYYSNRLTFLFHLTLYIWVVNDLTNSHTAEDRAQCTSLPAETVRAVQQSQAQVTGQIGAFTKQGCLKQRRNLAWNHALQTSNNIQVLFPFRLAVLLLKVNYERPFWPMLGLVHALFLSWHNFLGVGLLPSHIPQISCLAKHLVWTDSCLPGSGVSLPAWVFYINMTALLLKGISSIYWDCHHSRNPNSPKKARLYFI